MKRKEEAGYSGFVKLLRYVKGYRGQVFLAWGMVAIEVVCEVLIATFSENAVDAVEQATVSGTMNWGSLWLWCGLMMLLAVLSCTTGVVAGFAASVASGGYGKNLRAEMYQKIQTYSFTNIDRFSSASLITRLTTDVSNVQNSVQAILRTVVRAPMMLIFAFTMAMIKEWRLGLIFLALVPFLGTILLSITKAVHPTFVRVFEDYDKLNASVQENLNGIRVVKSFGREDFENEKFGKVSNLIYRGFLHAERILAFNSPALQFSVYAAMLLISWLGARLIVESGNVDPGFTTGKLTSMFSYVMQILNSLNMVSMAFVMITISRNSAERIEEVLTEVPTIQEPANPIMEVPNGQIDFNHVSFRYHESATKDVLHDIDLHFPSGSTIGIMGATGSSKSTLVSLLARLYDVSGGSVCVGGHDVREYNIKVLRDSVSYALQKNVLFNGTIRSNLLWGNENATEEELINATRLACADEFISKMPKGLDSPIEEGGTNVSGGQRQRLCIARALLKNPRVLVLDDSTSAVDTHTDSLIRERLKTLLPDVTKVIVSQRVLSIKDCDYILLLDDGKVLALGSHEQLMKSSEAYQELVETQLGGGDFDGE
ncbi:MAG: ABC transporter ATP-binding protein [Bacillales bacterium]|nr:ABC transporter ATP-binding protein [Bacillales bacterium]MDY5920325.1 ABC transporter ATP-binding protein [Candidatus Enteromonas sp.]